MKTIYQLPTREPPRLAGLRPEPEPPWPPGTTGHMFTKTKLQNQKFNERNTMKKDRKKQDDRLLKRLPLHERRQQERLRQQIMSEKLFLAV